MFRLYAILILSFYFSNVNYSQDEVQNLVSALLAETPIEEDLQELCDDIGGRVTGSSANEKAVEWAYSKFADAGVRVKKDPFEMPILWLSKGSSCRINEIDFEPLVVSKYNTIPGEYSGKLIYVGMGTAADFDAIGNEKIKDQFLLVESDLCLDINGLFAEYAHATNVEMEAYHRGAKGIIFMSSRPNKVLYRFLTAMVTQDNIIPQLVMAREDAMRCVRAIESGKELSVHMTIAAKTGPAFTSHNVIGEIKGSEKPDEVVIIGSHLDSWAMGTGANDNGCNVNMMIDIARQMKRLGIKPKRTIRFALWNGEEQGYFGSWDYTKDHEAQLDKHIMTLSVDIGSGAIDGFFTNGRAELVPIVEEVLKPVSELGTFSQINAPIVGTDNFDFMLQGVPNLVASHLPQVYGQNYHASTDTYDKVDLKQLKINSAVVGALTLGFANLSDEKASTLPQQKRAAIQKIFDDFDLEFTMRMFDVWEPWVNETRGMKSRK